MSVNSTVASMRSGSRSWRVPVRNSSISPSIASLSPIENMLSLALELHVARARDALGDVARVLDLDEGVVAAVHHERRHADRGQHVAHVELADQVEDAPDRPRAGRQPLEPAGPLHEAGIVACGCGATPPATSPSPQCSTRWSMLAVALLGGPGPLVVRAPRWRGRRWRTGPARSIAVGVGGREQRRHRPALERAADRRPLRAGGVHAPRARRPSAPRAWARRRAGRRAPSRAGRT